MDWHSIQEREEILPLDSCQRNQDKLQLFGQVTHVDIAFLQITITHSFLDVVIKKTAVEILQVYEPLGKRQN